MIRFRGFRGGFEGERWSNGGLVDPHRALFAPLEVMQGAGFGSKHHMMVQLTHANRVGITDPFPELRSPPWGQKNAIICANNALLRPQ